ncbi:MAG: hypothetical protein HYX47_17275 [Burkholderiales bacterium]|nr:hypothetical protein [Burkholderiales bacterium]
MLIIALIMLVVISLLATMSVKNAASSEGVNGNIRLSQLASQSAEIALRYCEDAVIQMVSGTGTLVLLPTIQNYAATPSWKLGTTSWDVTPTVAFPLPIASVNASAASATYARPPECMVERLSPAGSAKYSSNFVVTARGFGPEVPAATSARARPNGSEVFMQSTIELN